MSDNPTPAWSRPPKRAKLQATSRNVALGSVAVLVLLLGSCSVLSHSTTVEPGNVGVKIKTLGSGAGVASEPLPARWYFRGIGERIIQYPVIQRTYSYTREKDERGNEKTERRPRDRRGFDARADGEEAHHAPALSRNVTTRARRQRRHLMREVFAAQHAAQRQRRFVYEPSVPHGWRVARPDLRKCAPPVGARSAGGELGRSMAENQDATGVTVVACGGLNVVVCGRVNAAIPSTSTPTIRS